ncbi:MAG TPA: hypothetical protein VMS56_02245 [Thermoanaerobaculia bacterium]|nr:hypothetical protein [Thermoanaerobaculia bacterium]
MRTTIRTATLLLITALLAAPLLGHPHREARSCSDLQVQFGDDPMVQSEETLRFSPRAPLTIEGSKNGGIQLRGGGGTEIVVQVCKLASANRGGDALLSAIRIDADGGAVRAEGPSSGRWTVFYLVEAPDGSEIEMTAHNGPISIRSIDGRISAITQNGPISLREVGGTIRADAQNGPISLAGGSGDVRLDAKNGPISVTLDGTGWIGAGLEGVTRNGPVSVRVPRAYASGIVVEGSTHSPFRCEDEICAGGRRDFDDRRKRVELGGGTQVVRLSTTNGPVSVRSDD